MSSEGFYVTNPKGNNRDIEILRPGRDGALKKLKTLRPGETSGFEKREVLVREVRRPPKLLLHADGTYSEDRLR